MFLEHLSHFIISAPFLPRDTVSAWTDCGRHSGLMVNELDSGLSCPGSRPGQGHCVVFFGIRHLVITLTVPLSTQVYKIMASCKFTGNVRGSL